MQSIVVISFRLGFIINAVKGVLPEYLDIFERFIIQVFINLGIVEVGASVVEFTVRNNEILI